MNGPEETQDPRDAAAITDEHLAEVAEETIHDLLEGANFVVECPTCGALWALAVPVITLAALANTYGNRNLDSRFRTFALTPPAIQCGTCIFTGATEDGM